MTLVMTVDLAMRIETSERNALNSRLTAVSDQEGNPMGIEICEIGGATLFATKGIPGPSYNKVLGITDRDTPFLEEIIDFYRKKNIPCIFELIPGCVTDELFQALSTKGGYQKGFHTALYRNLIEEQEVAMNINIQIRELEIDEFMLFGQIYCKGFGMPDFLSRGVAENNQVLYENKKWKHYLATIDGETAGVGVLFLSDNTANLAAAATLPEYRGKGCQSALINRRISDAIKDNCELIVGQAVFASTSMTNMQRQGMQIAYTKAIWGFR
jgi:ribosomal protein S18 acetylase RimI-like enzyme